MLLTVPIKLTEVPSDVLIDDDSTQARFNCSATSDSSTPVTLTWQKDGQHLQLLVDPRLTLGESQDLVIDLRNLTLDAATLSYLGEYECHVSNGYQHRMASAYLDVQEKTVLPGTGEPNFNIVSSIMMQSWQMFPWLYFFNCFVRHVQFPFLTPMSLPGKNIVLQQAYHLHIRCQAIY